MSGSELTVNYEAQRLELERKRYELEERNARDTKLSDEKRYTLESSSKKWSQLAVFFPLMAILFGAFINEYQDTRKYNRDLAAEVREVKRAFISKQLDELYYPLQLRLKKDDAVWQLWNQNQFDKKNEAIAKQVEKDTLMTNHDEILKIIDKNWNLVRNDYENVDLTKLYATFYQYQRHIAAYKALRATNDPRNPPDLRPDPISKQGYAFPVGFSIIVDERIKQLEAQYRLFIPEALSADE